MRISQFAGYRRAATVASWVAVGLGSYGVLIFGAEYQREHLGKAQGNTFLWTEVAFGLLVVWAIKSYQNGSRHRARLVIQVAGAIFLAVMGWLILPGQVYDRAGDRAFEADQKAIDYNRSQASPYREDKPDSPREQVRARALHAIGARAAHLEEAATDLRYLKAQDYGIEYLGMNDVLSYSLWLLAGGLLVNVAITRRAQPPADAHNIDLE